MAVRKYATIHDLAQVESRLRTEIKASSPNGELKRLSRAVDRFDRIADTVEAIVAERQEGMADKEAIARALRVIGRYLGFLVPARKFFKWAGMAIGAAACWKVAQVIPTDALARDFLHLLKH